MKQKLQIFLFFFVVSTIAVLVVLQFSDSKKDVSIESLKKEMESSAILSARSVALTNDSGFIDLIVSEQKKRGVEIVIAEKLLFPPEGSLFVAGYSVVRASSPEIVKSLSHLKESDLLSGSIDIRNYVGVLKVINTPKRILVVQLVKQSSYDQKDSERSSLVGVSIVAIYLMGLLGFVLTSLPKVSIQRQKNAVNQSGLTPRERLLEDIKNSSSVALLLLDIEGFNKINEFYTHRVGDFFLDEFYKILGFHITENGTIYRLGGDEFAILLKNSSLDQAQKLAQNLAESIPNESVFYEEFEISVELFIGVAFSGNNLLEKADTALRVAKKERKSRVVTFSPALDPKDRLKRDLEWAKKVYEAIDKERVSTHFQQIVDSKSGDVFAHEALVRLVDDSGNEVLPFQFLKSAKLSKQYSKLSRAVLRKTVADFSLRKEVLSINITIDDILDRETLNFAKELIRKYDLGHRVIFEILLEDTIYDIDSIKQFIDQLKVVGCSFAIDNFGANKISLDLAATLGVDFIKIDSSIIEKIDKDENSLLLARGIVEFAKAQNIKTVAKFVSSESLKAKAIEIGVDYLQGYNIAKPTDKI